MFKALFGRKINTVHAHALYGRVVARARDEHFYSKLGVPDTFDGRFEMLIMHLFMIHARLKDEGKKARSVSQRVFDCFIDDMDSTLRELGVGDQVVPKRIKKMTRVFYGRVGAYEAALQASDTTSELGDVILRNLFDDIQSKCDADVLGRYMAAEITALAATKTDDIVERSQVFSGQMMDAGY